MAEVLYGLTICVMFKNTRNNSASCLLTQMQEKYKTTEEEDAHYNFQRVVSSGKTEGMRKSHKRALNCVHNVFTLIIEL